MMRKTKLDIGLKIMLVREGDFIIAYSPELDFSSYGNDEQDALQAFEEGVTLFLEETYKMGTLEQVLLDLGWTLKKKPVASYIPPIEEIRPNAPSGLLQRNLQERISIPI